MTSFPSTPRPTCSRLVPNNIADKGSPSPTTQTTPGIDDRLVKRELEDKIEYKDRQIDGWKNQLAVFSLKNFSFEKDTFLPVKIQSR